jgi:hypothetical protein
VSFMAAWTRYSKGSWFYTVLKPRRAREIEQAKQPRVSSDGTNIVRQFWCSTEFWTMKVCLARGTGVRDGGEKDVAALRKSWWECVRAPPETMPLLSTLTMMAPGASIRAWVLYSPTRVSYKE